MKTKEIEVWVNDNFIEYKVGIGDVVRDIGFEQFINGNKATKAKLIIEIPEKKIEITESEFDEAVGNVGLGSNMTKYLKKELGF
jgi:hypothetical protein